MFGGHIINVSGPGDIDRSRCVFCERPFIKGDQERERSGEHAWPKWLAKALPGGGGQKFKHNGPRARTSKGFDLQAKIVCRGCNHGWMEETIEDAAKPHLWPAIQGAAVTYSAGATERMAYWALKTAMIIDWTWGQPSRALPVEMYPELYAAQGVLPNTFVWIGGWDRNNAVHALNGNLHFAPDKGVFNSVWFGLLGVGSLILLVVRRTDSSEASLHIDNQKLGGPKLLPIWPPQGPVMFPPVPIGTLFSDEALHLLAINLVVGEALKPA